LKGAKLVEKHFITANELLQDSYHLGHYVLESGFTPNYLVGVWRGGAPVGIAVQELLEYHGVSTDHIAIRTSSYDGIDKRRNSVQVHGLHYIIENVNAEDNLLIIDDVFDSGNSVKTILDTIQNLSRRNAPFMKVATVYYKPGKRKVETTPDFYVHETEKWLVFPHELQGLSEQEIQENKPFALRGQSLQDVKSA
jgi:hypoxanthine phosphoribosyltransferase